MINQIIDTFINTDTSIWAKYLVLKLFIKYILFNHYSQLHFFSCSFLGQFINKRPNSAITKSGTGTLKHLVMRACS